METRGGITQTTLAVGTGGATMVVSNEIRLLSGEIWWVSDGDDDIQVFAYSTEYMYCT